MAYSSDLHDLLALPDQFLPMNTSTLVLVPPEVVQHGHPACGAAALVLALQHLELVLNYPMPQAPLKILKIQKIFHKLCYLTIFN